MVDMQFIFQTLIGVAVLAAIALIGSNFATIVSIVSGQWRTSLDRARQQKARRERLYGYADMSSLEPVLDDSRTSSRSGSAGSWDLVPGQQHQAEPQEPGESEPDEKSFARQLAREELIITLAVQRKDNGDYLFSANDITKFVGGAAAPVKATIANVRGKRETPPASRSVQRPLNGW